MMKYTVLPLCLAVDVGGDGTKQQAQHSAWCSEEHEGVFLNVVLCMCCNSLWNLRRVALVANCVLAKVNLLLTLCQLVGV